MASRKPAIRRRLRFMLDGYMVANNIERPRHRGETSMNLMTSGQRKAQSPVHARTPHVHSPHHLPLPPHALDEENVFPDAGGNSDPTQPDDTTSQDPSQCDDFGDNTQPAGSSGVSPLPPLPGPSDVSPLPGLRPVDPSQLPDADYMGPPQDIEPDELLVDDEDTVSSIRLPKLQTTQKFIDLLRTASLDDTGMDPEDIETIRNPEPTIDLVNPSPMLRSIRHFINNAGSSRDHYENLREIELLDNPERDFLSFDQVKRRICHLSGVVPLEYDMCPGSCVAYVGPYRDLDKCPTCKSTRYYPDSSKPQKQFWTVPIGPVIQAFYGSCEIAENMHYLERKLAENLETARLNGGTLPVYDDTTCGSDLLNAWQSGRFGKSDIALQLSIDGAQLRRDQASDAWVFIWIIHNLPPNMRYKKAFVIPAAIVPGPNKPGEIDSFLFPSLHHVAALQREGLKIFDSYLDTVVPRSTPVILFSTADSPGSASMSGMVGHTGKYGCRLHCEMPSRHRKGDSHYFPAMSRPENYSVARSCHPDVTPADLGKYRRDLPRKYKMNIHFLLGATTQRNFAARRLAVGLCKQTLFSGLPRQPLPVPNIFTMDLMHLSVLNDPDLFVKLFTGKLDCFEPDDRSTWDWAVFHQNPALWTVHGETVFRCIPYLPSSFGRAPRDPAKRINSGYKAWEYQQYIYGLGPTLFRHILPRRYWINFCKLVASIRILQRHRINRLDILKAHVLLEDFVQEYETLYYQRMESRIHFVQQSIHMLTHIAPETMRASPLSCYAQWTLETAIGNLG